ncbi:MAG: TonB-dependent receptor [Pseudomonadota bacterium]
MKAKSSILIAAMMSTTSALAQTGEANEEVDEIIVKSVRRVATPISDVTRSVTVITSEELNIQSDLNRSAGSVIAQNVPGFSPSTEALTNFGQQLRGRNFQTLIDGVPQDTPLRNGARSLQSIDIDAIEQIEVVRGGTAIYGFGADGGLINYITKVPEDGEFNASARAGLSFSTVNPDDSLVWNTSLQTSGRSGDVDYLLSGTFVNRNGTFDADGNRRLTDPVGAQGGLDESDEYNVLGKLGYQIDADQRLQGNFNYFSLKQDPDFGARLSTASGELFLPPFTPEIAIPGNDNDVNPGNEALTGYLTYTHENVFGSSVEVQGYYQQIDTVFTLFPGFPQTEIQSEKFGFRLTGNTPVELEALPFDVTWGIDYLNDDTEQFDVVGGGDDARGVQDAIAGFAQVEIPLRNFGILTAGVRHEDVSIDISGVDPTGEANGSETLFNASVSFFLTENFTLFGGFSQSFSPGDILRVITDGTFATIDDVELEFVRTNNYEGGLRANFDFFTAEAVGFFSGSDNGATFDTNLEILTQPEEIWGFEASMNIQPTDQLDFGATLSIIDGEVDLDDDGDFDEDLPTTRIPPEKVTAYVNYAPYDWWDLRAQLFYSGTQSNNSTAFGGGSEIDSYTLIDLYSSFDVGPGALSVGVTNLLNNDYLPVINQAFNFQFSNVQGPGRRLSFAYRVRF